MIALEHNPGRIVVVLLLLVMAMYVHCRHSHDAAQTAVTAPGRTDRIVGSAGARVRKLDMAAGTRRLVGRTLDVRERPIGGATVTLDAARTTTSEADGSFAFDRLATGDHRVVADRWPAHGEITLSLDDRAEPAVITLLIGPTVVVRVVDRAGAPVAGARLWDRHAEFTDRDGKATFRSVDSPHMQLEVAARGYASQAVSVPVGDDPRRTVDAKVVLQPSVPIGGAVIDQDGKPVSGATIYARVVDPRWIEYTTSDAQGRWKIESTGRGRVDLMAYSDVDVTVPTPLVDIGTRPRPDLVLRVERGATISGVAVDAAGKPLAGVRVLAGPGDVHTDEHGRFDVAGVRPGEAFIDASRASLGTPTRIVHVARGGHVEVRLEMVESSIAGVVTTRRGEPVANALLLMEGPLHGNDSNQRAEHSDRSGHFDFKAVPPGDYKLLLARDLAPTDSAPRVIVHSGNRNLALVVPDVASIRGRVVLGGKPVDFFGVTATSDPGKPAAPAAHYSHDGRFELDGVNRGTVSVVLVGPSFRRRVIDGIVVAANQPIELGDLAVTAGSAVRGRVVDTSGAPVAGATVVVQHGGAFTTLVSLDNQNRGARGAYTDASGRFDLVGLPDDLSGLRIQAREPEHGLAVPHALTTADLDRDVELVLAATGSVAGTVVNDPPGPIWHVIRATSVTDGHSYEATSSDGKFTIGQLSPGDYLASLDDLVISPVAFHVEANRTTMVSVTRPARGASLTSGVVP